MPAIQLSAHFDGERILLDEPFELLPNTKLVVMVPVDTELDLNGDRGDWLSLSGHGLMDAYDENEPEYSMALIKEVNPEYARR